MVVSIIFEPFYDVLAVRAISVARVRVGVPFAVAGHVVLVEFHDLLVQLLVQVLRHD